MLLPLSPTFSLVSLEFTVSKIQFLGTDYHRRISRGENTGIFSQCHAFTHCPSVSALLRHNDVKWTPCRQNTRTVRKLPTKSCMSIKSPQFSFLHVAGPLLITIAANILAVTTTATAPRYVAMMLMPASFYAASIVVLTWISVSRSHRGSPRGYVADNSGGVPSNHSIVPP